MLAEVLSFEVLAFLVAVMALALVHKFIMHDATSVSLSDPVETPAGAKVEETTPPEPFINQYRYDARRRRDRRGQTPKPVKVARGGGGR